MKMLFYTINLLASLFLISFEVHAQNNLPPVYEIKTDTASFYKLPDSCLRILEDKSAKLTINDVANDGLNNKVHFHTANLKNNHTLVNAYWFIYRLKNTMPKDAHISLKSMSAFDDFYLPQPNAKWIHYTSGYSNKKSQGYKWLACIPDTVKSGEEVIVYQRIYNSQKGLPRNFNIGFLSTEKVQVSYKNYLDDNYNTVIYSLMNLDEAFIVGLLFLSTVFSLFFFSVVKEKVYLYFALFTFFLVLNRLYNILDGYLIAIHSPYDDYVDYLGYAWSFIMFFLVQFIRQFFKTKKYQKKWDRYLSILAVAVVIIDVLDLMTGIYFKSLKSFRHFIFLWSDTEFFIVPLSICITFLLFIRTKDKAARLLMVGALPYMLLMIMEYPFQLLDILSIPVPFNFKNISDDLYRTLELMCLIWLISLFCWTMFMRYNQLRKENVQKSLDNERLAKEKETERRELIEQQNTELEKQVIQRTSELRHSLEELKATQAQLIQSEKMASLGELTAGIAHEIQNPLNFVNNFSELNKELLEELKEEAGKGNLEDVKTIANDVIENETKINHHGKRADAIVKGMLQHSRQTKGVKELTDINTLCDEYLRLSYHGLRAKDKSFNADFTSDFDENMGKIKIVPQDMGRVLLNLFNNAFYAVSERRKVEGEGFKPSVSVQTKRLNEKVEIVVKDNGNGIPQHIIDKIFQPFFTTKPTGQGTGLGLSLSYDIVTKEHNGNIKVESKEGEGTTFAIVLPA